MVILLEGADGAGKSTLYDKLKKSLNSKFNFIKHLDRDKLGHHHWWKTKIESEEIYVIDRGFLSEIVYRPIKLDKIPNVSLNEFADLCSDKLLIIYCKSSSQLQDMLNRGDDYVNSDEYPIVTKTYDIIIDILKMFSYSYVIDYDWTKDDYDDLVTKINSFKMFKEN